jgi:hypothetical protein
MTRGWAARARGRPGSEPNVSLLECMNPIISTLDGIITSGSDRTVGGGIEALMLSAREVGRVDGIVRIDGNTGSPTRLNLVRLRLPSLVDSSMHRLEVKASVSGDSKMILADALGIPRDAATVSVRVTLNFTGYGAGRMRLELERPNGSRELLRDGPLEILGGSNRAKRLIVPLTVEHATSGRYRVLVLLNGVLRAQAEFLIPLREFVW